MNTRDIDQYHQARPVIRSLTALLIYLVHGQRRVPGLDPIVLSYAAADEFLARFEQEEADRGQ